MFGTKTCSFERFDQGPNSFGMTYCDDYILNVSSVAQLAQYYTKEAVKAW